MTNTVARGSHWFEPDEENKSILEEKYLKILCLLWDKETLQQKGPYPKFTVYFTAFGQLTAFFLEVVIVTGIGTGWFLPGLIPMTIACICAAVTSIIELRIPKEKKSKKFELALAFQGLMFVAAFIVILICKKPFNNMVTFICIQMIIFLIGSFSSVQAKMYEQEAQKNQVQASMNLSQILQDSQSNRRKHFHRDYGAIYRNQFKNRDIAREAAQKKKELFVKCLWITFASCVTAIDFLSDIYYGLQLQITTKNSNMFITIAGIFILLTAAVDMFIVIFTLTKPYNVNHRSHIGALFLEFFSFAGTAYSLYVLLTEDGQETMSNFQDGISFAIFSLITTVIAIIIHGFYVVDYFFQKAALEQIQLM
eukprot:TRINITY_DN2370_c0_g2_i1.p1 TRINITY_DN2370_c0_g2~~TRINITY_DN2370_c0_g2_i1.p1  ORF type:complete len:366 (-),score=-2.49 TRINITY_DN2370_c0_g2_i1:443-1540(-)